MRHSIHAPVAVLTSSGAVTFLLAVSAPAAAQSEAALKAFFEGRQVVLRIDMPGTSDGVNVSPDSRRALDYEEYRDSLKKYGTALTTGDSATVTVVKVKKDLIEFQLGGGGFGTFGDDTSTSVYRPLIDKGSREKDLEKKVDDEQDRRKRRELERELDDLRDRRERRNRRIMAERAVAEEQKRERVAASRLRGGSRFNLHYDDGVPTGMRPSDVIAALAEYVDFGALDVRVGRPAPPGDVMPRKGMLRDDALAAFGSPVRSSERREGTVRIVTEVFEAAGQRITADFVEDVMVRYTVTSR